MTVVSDEYVNEKFFIISIMITSILNAFVVIIFFTILYLIFAVYIRRLHNTGASGWFALLVLIPVIDFLLFIYLLFAPREKGANKYGKVQK